MKLDATITVGAVCGAMAGTVLDGATVQQLTVTIGYRDRDGAVHVLTERRKGGDRLTVADAEIDDDDAMLKLADVYGGVGEDEANPVYADLGDVADFIAACRSGDNATALALAARIFDGPPLDMAEACLLASRRAA